MNGHFWRPLIVLCLVAFLHSASIMKKEDPIRKTQTDPITVKDKMEEIKDGEKEAPLPSFKYYPVVPAAPVSTPQNPNSPQGQERLPDINEAIPEGEAEDEDWSLDWFEEDSQEEAGEEAGEQEAKGDSFKDEAYYDDNGSAFSEENMQPEVK